MASYVFPVASGNISSVFGDSRDNGARSHAGVDVAVPVGTAVRSMATGRVSYTGYNSSRGNYMKVDNADGTVSLYQHLSEFAARVGDAVKAGDTIALSGNSGVGTGPHLHYELLKNGTPIDPLSVSYSSQAHAGGGRGFGGASVNSAGIVDAIKDNWLIIAGALVLIALLTKK